MAKYRVKSLKFLGNNRGFEVKTQKLQLATPPPLIRLCTRLLRTRLLAGLQLKLVRRNWTHESNAVRTQYENLEI